MSHLAFHGLRESPFAITPDTGFFYSCDSTRSGLNTLLVALEAGEGFIKVTGEVGTGKTLLCRMLLAALEAAPAPRWITAYIHNPDLEPRALLLAIAEEMRVRIDDATDQHQMQRMLNYALLETAREGCRVVVCLDEAQAMETSTLESLRLLTNLETEKRKLVQVVLFGQPELDRRLAEHRIRQLKQRITFQHVLTGLTREETGHYLNHRLAVAGHTGDRVFSGTAVRILHRASRGTPRLVNILANKALMLAYGRGSRRVGWREALAACGDTPASRGVIAACARLGWLPGT